MRIRSENKHSESSITKETCVPLKIGKEREINLTRSRSRIQDQVCILELIRKVMRFQELEI